MNDKKHKKTCAYCSKVYYAKNIRGTYCSDNCRVKANRKFSVKATQNSPVELKEEEELKIIENQIQQNEAELQTLSENANRAKAYEDKKELYNSKIAQLQNNRSLLVRNNGKFIKGGELTKDVADSFKDPVDKLLAGAFTYLIESNLGNPMKFQNHDQAIKRIDQEIKSIENEFKQLRVPLFFETLYNDDKTRIYSDLTSLRSKKKELEEFIRKAKNSKDLSQLKDKDGFISAKDVSNAKFPDRIKLGNDIGDFLGPIERNRCAISLSGIPGSGKTYFSFDLMKGFIDLGLSAGYFSMEEGISDLTREKIELYGLQNEENCKFRENATLEDIQNYAKIFDVIVIDSWGKLNTEIDEFDKLRVKFPNTFFIVIFQLTSSKQMRGGPKAAYDASVNITTFSENDKRYAINTKNRYVQTGFVYSIDTRKIVPDPRTGKKR